MDRFDLPPPPSGRIGLALGGGAAKGWAHIGVVRTLLEAGWRPAVVAGTSIGAVVGAAVASGSLDGLDGWVRGLRWRDVMGYLDPGFGGGLIRARRVVEDFVGLLPARAIDGLDLPFGAVATELATGREIWLTEGDVMEAVRASIAIPGMIAPQRHQGRWLVDGGLVNPVPVSLCRALGADVVVAVDLQTTLIGRRVLEGEAVAGERRATEERRPEAPPAAAGGEAAAPAEGGAPWEDEARVRNGRGFWRRLRRRGGELQGRAAHEARATPSLHEVVATSINVMQMRIGRSRLAGDPPEVLITPRLPEIGLLDFHRADLCIPEGRRAARAALAAAASGGVPGEA